MSGQIIYRYSCYSHGIQKSSILRPSDLIFAHIEIFGQCYRMYRLFIAITCIISHQESTSFNAYTMNIYGQFLCKLFIIPTCHGNIICKRLTPQ